MFSVGPRGSLLPILITATLLAGCRQAEGPDTNLAHLRPLSEPKVETRRAPGVNLRGFATYGVLAMEEPGSAVGSKLLDALVRANLELAGYAVCDEKAQAVIGVIASPTVQQTYQPPRTAWISQWESGQTSTVITSTGQSAQVHQPGRSVLRPVSVPGRTRSERWLHLYLCVADLDAYRSGLSPDGTDTTGLALAKATVWECLASGRIQETPAYAAALPLLLIGLREISPNTGIGPARGVGRLEGLTFAYGLIEGDELVPVVGPVDPGSVGERAGFLAEDIVLAIDHVPTASLTPAACRELLVAPKDPPRTITVKRLGKEVVLRLVPTG